MDGRKGENLMFIPRRKVPSHHEDEKVIADVVEALPFGLAAVLVGLANEMLDLPMPILGTSEGGAGKYRRVRTSRTRSRSRWPAPPPLRGWHRRGRSPSRYSVANSVPLHLSLMWIRDEDGSCQTRTRRTSMQTTHSCGQDTVEAKSTQRSLCGRDRDVNS